MKRHRAALIESGCLIVLGLMLPSVAKKSFCLVWMRADESGAKMAITCVKIQRGFDFTDPVLRLCVRQQGIKRWDPPNNSWLRHKKDPWKCGWRWAEVIIRNRTMAQNSTKPKILSIRPQDLKMKSFLFYFSLSQNPDLWIWSVIKSIKCWLHWKSFLKGSWMSQPNVTTIQLRDV